MRFIFKASILPFIITIIILLIQTLNIKFGDYYYLPWLWTFFNFFPLLFISYIRRVRIRLISLFFLSKVLFVLYFVSIPVFILSLPIVLQHSSLSLLDCYLLSLPFFIFFQIIIFLYLLFEQPNIDLIKSKKDTSNYLDEETKHEVRVLIKNNQIDQVFDILSIRLTRKTDINLLTMLRQRWNKKELDEDMKIFSKENMDIESSKIIKALLNIVK